VKFGVEVYGIPGGGVKKVVIKLNNKCLLFNGKCASVGGLWGFMGVYGDLWRIY
jgi:hypothetical protein